MLNGCLVIEAVVIWWILSASGRWLEVKMAETVLCLEYMPGCAVIEAPMNASKQQCQLMWKELHGILAENVVTFK